MHGELYLVAIDDDVWVVVDISDFQHVADSVAQEIEFLALFGNGEVQKFWESVHWYLS